MEGHQVLPRGAGRLVVEIVYSLRAARPFSERITSLAFVLDSTSPVNERIDNWRRQVAKLTCRRRASLVVGCRQPTSDTSGVVYRDSLGGGADGVT
jgi:hypothetical protein